MRTLLNRIMVKLGIHGKSHHNREEALLDYEASVMGLGCGRNETTGSVEVNGPANIIMMLEAMDMIGAISQADYKLLRQEAEKIVKYMKLLDNPNKVHWHDVI